jgi:hypothetical protein
MRKELLPDPFNCPICEYDLGASTLWTCSECGHACTHGDVARADCRPTLRRLVMWHAALGIIAMALGDLFALGVVRHAEDAVTITLVLGSLVLGSTGAGMWMAQAASRPERMGWRIAWLRAQVWLHVPWISMVAGLVSCMAGNALNHGRGDQTLPLGMLVWIGVLIISPAMAIHEWMRIRRLYHLKHRTPVVYFPIALTLVFAAVFLCTMGAMSVLEMGRARF